jgi:hypothetical protein
MVLLYGVSLGLDKQKYWVLSGLLFGLYNLLMYFYMCKLLNFFGFETDNIHLSYSVNQKTELLSAVKVTLVLFLSAYLSCLQFDSETKFYFANLFAGILLYRVYLFHQSTVEDEMQMFPVFKLSSSTFFVLFCITMQEGL